jgi:hypothetical protein
MTLRKRSDKQEPDNHKKPDSDDQEQGEKKINTQK